MTPLLGGGNGGHRSHDPRHSRLAGRRGRTRQRRTRRGQCPRIRIQTKISLFQSRSETLLAIFYIILLCILCHSLIIGSYGGEPGVQHTDV